MLLLLDKFELLNLLLDERQNLALENVHFPLETTMRLAHPQLVRPLTQQPHQHTARQLVNLLEQLLQKLMHRHIPNHIIRELHLKEAPQHHPREYTEPQFSRLELAALLIATIRLILPLHLFNSLIGNLTDNFNILHQKFIVEHFGDDLFLPLPHIPFTEHQSFA